MIAGGRELNRAWAPTGIELGFRAYRACGTQPLGGIRGPSAVQVGQAQRVNEVVGYGEF